MKTVIAVVTILFIGQILFQQQPAQPHAKEKETKEIPADENKNSSNSMIIRTNEDKDTKPLDCAAIHEAQNRKSDSGVHILGVTLSSDWVMVMLTGALVALTLAYVGVTCWQVWTVHRTERAWIIITLKNWSPELAYIDPSVGGAIPINVSEISVKNIGNTPAKIIELAWRYRTIDRLEDLPKEPDYGETSKFNELLLVPRDSLGKTVVLEPNPSLSIEETRLIQSARKFVYAYGFVSYKDVYGHKRETRRCYIYDFPQGLLVSIHKARFQFSRIKKYNDAT